VPLHVDGNPVLLTEMFKNLIDNAIKYTPVGGVVTVRLRADIRAIFEVEDSGSGIAVDDRQRVFERFYRVLGTQAEGSGLGLPIVREIAELHRADVGARTQAPPRGELSDRLAHPPQTDAGDGRS
jgi:two-component system sensor histidine kinase TctE